MKLKPGPGNDVVTIAIDGHRRITGTTWENYYRYDPEQAPLGNLVPTIDKLLFRVSGNATPADAGHGFLVDNVRSPRAGTRSAFPVGATSLTRRSHEHHGRHGR